ncbi:Acetyl-CoA hydrolase OS=Lysinibacillus sphaericus OX=1421 GN=LS41612_20870 PE=3 SV=1 [Lysinibacillus sphaericus]
MVLGMSGFTRAGDVKVVPLALVEKAKTESFKVDVYTGESLATRSRPILSRSGCNSQTSLSQGYSGIRNMINSGEVTYVDAHLSHNAELVRQGIIGSIDFAIIEAAAITEDGLLIPTTSVGNSPILIRSRWNY